jgi:putative FmdB family regulatory protein
MPTYEYECQKCQHRFDLFQPITDKPKRTCPQCGGRVKRLVGTGAGIIFKGSGFYATDYRPTAYREAARKDCPAAAPAAASPSPKASKAEKPASGKTTPTKG